MKIIRFLSAIILVLFLSSCVTTGSHPVESNKKKPDIKIRNSDGSLIKAEAVFTDIVDDAGLQRFQVVVLKDPNNINSGNLYFVQPGQAFVQGDPNQYLKVATSDNNFIVSRDAMNFSISWVITNVSDKKIVLTGHKLWFRAGSHWKKIWLGSEGSGTPGGGNTTLNPGESWNNTSTFDFHSGQALLDTMVRDGADPEYGVWFIPEFIYMTDGKSYKMAPEIYLVDIK